MRKFLLFIILVPALGYGGLEFYIRYKVNKAMEQVIALAIPYVLIQYGGVTWTFKGAVGITDLHVASQDTPDQVRVKSVLLHAPDLLFLLQGGRRLEQGEFPERLGLSLIGMAFNADSDIMYQANPELAGTNPLLQEHACGDIKYLGPEEWIAMGYDSFITDIKLDYSLSTNKKQLKIKAKYTVQDMFAMDFDLRLVNNAPITPLNLLGQKLKFGKFSFNYGDNSLIKRTNELCAEAESKKVGKKIKPAQYVLVKTDAIDSMLQAMGYQISDELLEAYRRFQTDPDTIQVNAAPNRPIDLSRLHLYKPNDVVQLLNLSISVNQTPITDLSIEGGTTTAPLILEKSPDPVVTGSSRQETRVETHWENRFVDVDLAAIGNYRSKHLRIHTSRGKVHEGKLLAVEKDGVLSVKKRAHGGSLVFDVPPRDVTRIEVLKRVKVEKVIVIAPPAKKPPSETP